jgi:acetylcholinesterase
MVRVALSPILWVLFHLAGSGFCSESSRNLGKRASPLVVLPNGTLSGAYNDAYDQDFFLGVPYAAAPVGNLRFRRPEPPVAWGDDVRQADSYGPWCLGNRLNLAGFSQNATGEMSEDCLHVNIVRPARRGCESSPLLPVLVWIHGGSWSEGSANDFRYNGSFLVHNSVEMGTPIIFVSFNYRLSLFGRLTGPAVTDAGLANLLLHD